MDTALVITWKVPFPGRERRALELAAQSEDYWGKQAAAGRCTSPEWFFLPNGVGMWMMKADRAVLEELLASTEARRLLVRGSLLLEDWQYALADTASRAQQFMENYATELETL